MQIDRQSSIDVLLQEKRCFPPPDGFRKTAWVANDQIYQDAANNTEAFWARFAEELVWVKKWDRILEWDPPYAKWFVGGKINAAVNCVDRWAKSELRNKAAIIWEGEPGDQRTLTFWDLYREVNQFASALKRLNVKKSDRVALYLPMIPEAV